MEPFARREGIYRLTLAKCCCDLQARGGRRKPMNFTEVKPGPPPGPVAWAFELTLPNGWVVRAADASALAQLLSVVRS
jgi:hypothetical protein